VRFRLRGWRGGLEVAPSVMDMGVEIVRGL